MVLVPTPHVSRAVCMLLLTCVSSLLTNVSDWNGLVPAAAWNQWEPSAAPTQFSRTTTRNTKQHMLPQKTSRSTKKQSNQSNCKNIDSKEGRHKNNYNMNKDNANETAKDQDMDAPCPPHLLDKKIREMIHDDDITPFILMQNAGDLGWDIPPT